MVFQESIGIKNKTKQTPKPVIGFTTQDLWKKPFYVTHLGVELHESFEAEATTPAPSSFMFSGFTENSYEMRIIFVVYYNVCELQNTYEMISWIDYIFE